MTVRFSQLNVKKTPIITTTPDASPIIQPVEAVQLQNVTPDKHGSAEGNNSTTTTTTTTTTTNRNPPSPSMSVQTSPSLVGIPSFLDSVEEDNMNFHSPLDDLIEANRAELTSASSSHYSYLHGDEVYGPILFEHSSMEDGRNI
ncbi:hypothetical protein PPL_12142 [Heterostelium album PN500]|uniref:Uncharacterized protein n=1 Tax=Heterostelium pallidum (strain ATCC 26659 / Pp 5 / PN500) TaxID=670386 RepID=D3BLT8_HETP5|nr:hypothetical protein PPL_12142 [Heterostelium album PN500]EFA77539.1 hypothetical protein PPL_12142 [Heterostelium album PN500]|eukprot:XP_020429667.1 hypothetical protein PPL_12142 [Heterostelium album PN500]